MKELIIGLTDPGRTTAFAAEELKRLLSRVDPSAAISVASDRYDPERTDVLWVGLCPSFGVPYEESDRAVVNVNGCRGYITGSNERSVLIAVYRFLYGAGCRFVRPGKDGERAPEKSAASISVSLDERPSYTHRGVCIEGAVSYRNVLDMIDYLPKVGMNEYFIQFAVPTEFFARWYEHRGSKVLKPEWPADADGRALTAEMTKKLEAEIKKRSLRYHKVGHGWTCEPFGISGDGWSAQTAPLTAEQEKALALVNGKRGLWNGVPLNTNLCYSDKKVRDAVTDAITRYAADNPQVDVIHFWLADDSNNHCECENCRKARPSDLYVRMLNELDRKMTAAGLKTKIVFLIYVDLLWEPETEKIENPDRFIMMFAPITRTYGQNYGECAEHNGSLAPYERNRLKMPRSLSENIARLARWQKDFRGDSFAFDYHLMWAHVWDIGYEKCARNLFGDMKDLHKIGLDGMVSCQIQRCFLPTALPVVSMAAALWDENADFDRTADEYYRAAYGERGEKIRRAMKTLSGSVNLYESGSPMWNEKKAVRGLEELRSAVSDGTDPELSLYAGYLELLFDFFRAVDSGDGEKTRSAADRVFGFLWENEMKLQPVLDVWNTVGTLGRLIK